MSSIGNSGARSSGPTGCSVPGCSGGGGGAGRSGITLYHWRGISDSSRVNLVRSVTTKEYYRGGDPTSRGDDPPRPPRDWGDPSPQTPLGGEPSPQTPLAPLGGDEPPEPRARSDRMMRRA